MEDLKEIEGLLEPQPEQTTPQSRFKKYVKLALPHVALVAFVCLYAVGGALVFYHLESPNEDTLKALGQASIKEMRGHLIGLIRDGNNNEQMWRRRLEGELYNFNDKIYRAFKEQYVRYHDVKVTRKFDWSDKDRNERETENGETGEEEEEEDKERLKRHRGSKTREKGDKLWTASSALFFAATTMATIGYGNIVPATSHGRIACVVFALFGAPLAIITIGDLGKFLSECTIWLYKQMRDGRAAIRARWKKFRRRGNEEDVEEQSFSESENQNTLEDLDDEVDKTEVPVLLVFTILLLYIAFGGFLFSWLEGWTYMDAFYYSFISLTTIGFGDIVPENHDYIVLMLIYLGVGLAVTTMCIDLVGIQYIQKIHYFGRKFRGTDLLQLLKRKRMIERRLAMGQGEELLQKYIQQMQTHMPETVIADEPWEKLSAQVEWQLDDAVVNSSYCYNYPLAEKVPSPNVLSIRSYRMPSIYSNSSASARSMMGRYRSRGNSWDESGPSVSDRCSLTTEPSVHQRQAYWDNFRSPEPSVSSFEFEFPLPSPDYQGIATEARRSRRILSCPADTFEFPPPSQSPIGLACMEDWDSYIRMLEEYNKPYESPYPDSSSEDEQGGGFDLDLGAFELVDSGLTAESLLRKEDPVIFHQDLPVHSVHHDTVQTEAALSNLMSAPESMLTSAIPPIMVEDNYCFVVDGERVRMGDILGDDQWWRHTSRPTKYFYSEDLRQFHRVNCITAKGKVINAKLASGTLQVQSASAASSSSTPRSSVSGTSSKPHRESKVPLYHVYKVIRFYSFWKTCTSFHRIVTMIDKVSTDDRSANPDFKKRLFVQYLWRNAKPLDKARVEKEFDPRRQRLLRFVTDPSARKRFQRM